ncbi:MAG: S8 family serine peptidase [Bacteroidales bacterium]|nr:S8 family serine peptidase [Bacteroidales bacterium]
MKKGIVTTYLNVRTESPSVNAPNPRYYLPGDEIKIKNTVEGDRYKGNDKWYQLSIGGFVWSGGVEIVTEIESGIREIVIDHINYNRLINNVPDEWRNSMGRGVKIAVIDSGINLNHPDLHILQSNVFDVCNSDSGYNDTLGHGTHIAGLIDAKIKGIKGITGVAPEAELYIFKARHETKKFNPQQIAVAIEKALESGAKIINMSFKLSYFDDVKFKNAIQKAKENNCIMIAAAGDDEFLKYDQFNKPAFFEEMIAVGAVDIDFHQSNTKKYNTKLDFILPKKLLWSASTSEKNNYEQLEGSSMATALITGISALYFSFKGIYTDITKEQLLADLKNNAEDIMNYTSEEPLKYFSI